MELQVTITLSDRLFGLLEDKLPNLGRRMERAITKEIGSQARQELGVTVGLSADKGLTDEAPTVESPQEQAATIEMAPQAEEPTEVPSDPKSLAEKIREIMHRTRQRFEGEDYKDNATGEGYKKYHKSLTGLFKQIAISLGYERPSVIDTPEKVEAFREECEALIFDQDGFVSFPPAPF